MYQQISSNKRKSLVLLGGFILLYAGIGWVLSLWFGDAAFFIALGIAVIMVIVNLYMGDDLVLAVSGARKIESKDEAPELWRKVENLAITAGLPMPRLYIVPDDTPNAFAAGRKPEQAIVAVTSGLLEAARRGGAGGSAGARDEPHSQLRRAADDLCRGPGRARSRCSRRSSCAALFGGGRRDSAAVATRSCSSWYSSH